MRRYPKNVSPRHEKPKKKNALPAPRPVFLLSFYRVRVSEGRLSSGVPDRPAAGFSVFPKPPSLVLAGTNRGRFNRRRKTYGKQPNTVYNRNVTPDENSANSDGFPDFFFCTLTLHNAPVSVLSHIQNSLFDYLYPCKHLQPAPEIVFVM